MTDSPDVSDRSEDAMPVELQLQQISRALERLTELVAPLHQLLETQTSSEADAVARLQEVIEALNRIAQTLDVSARALAELTAAETLSPTLEARLRRMADTQATADRTLRELMARMDHLTDWLGAPPQLAAAPRS